MPMPETEEVMRNPDAPVMVGCFRCRKESPITECIKEEPLPAPNESVIEAFFACPFCGATKHSYFSTNELRVAQSILALRLAKYQGSKRSEDWIAYRTAQHVYQDEFDKVQKEYLKRNGKWPSKKLTSPHQ